MTYQATEEKTIYFDLPQTDGLKIKGILRGDLAGPLAVMMHGRPGNGNALLQYLGARYLHQHGISTLRLYMYDFEPDTRNLMDCSLDTHAADFEAVIHQLREQTAGQLFAIGHSYGGLTILKSTAALDGAVLWDPSHGLWWQEQRDAAFADKFPEVVVGNYVIGTAGAGWMYPTAAKAHDEHLGDTSGLAAKPYPIEVISAGKGALVDLGERYAAAANEPKRHIIIKNAGHSFEESDDVMLELFEETLSWLAKFTAKQA